MTDKDLRKKSIAGLMMISLILAVIPFVELPSLPSASATPSHSSFPSFIPTGFQTTLRISADPVIGQHNGAEVAVYDQTSTPIFGVTCPLPGASGGIKWDLMADNVGNDGIFETAVTYIIPTAPTDFISMPFGTGAPIAITLGGGATVTPAAPSGGFAWVDNTGAVPDNTNNVGIYKFASCGTEGPVPQSDFVGTTTFQVTAPSTLLTKTASPTVGLAPLPVLYTYTELNDGQLSLTNISVTDNSCGPVVIDENRNGVIEATETDTELNIGDSGDDGVINDNGILEPTEDVIFLCEDTLTQTTTNTAFATATVCAAPDCTILDGIITGDPAVQGNDPNERDSETVRVAATLLTKTANPTLITGPTSILYTYTETNTGQVDMTNVSITDSANPAANTCGPIVIDENRNGAIEGTETDTELNIGDSGDAGGPAANDDNGILNPGETVTFLCETTIDATTSNVAIATATLCLDSACTQLDGVIAGDPADLTDPETDDALVVRGGTELIKTANPTVGTAPLPVLYTYAETNTGGAGGADLTNISVTDNSCSPVVIDENRNGAIDGTETDTVLNVGDAGDAGGPVADDDDGILQPGETVTFLCADTINQTTTNIAFATATICEDVACTVLDGTIQGSPTDTNDPETDDAEVRIARTQMTKLANGADPLPILGPTPILYSYTELNTGDVEETNVFITDSANPAAFTCGPIVIDENRNGVIDGETDTVLNVGDSGDAGGNVADDNDGILQPGEDVIFLCEIVVDDSVQNDAFATGTLCEDAACTVLDGIHTGDPAVQGSDPNQRDDARVLFSPPCIPIEVSDPISMNSIINKRGVVKTIHAEKELCLIPDDPLTPDVDESRVRDVTIFTKIYERLSHVPAGVDPVIAKRVQVVTCEKEVFQAEVLSCSVDEPPVIETTEFVNCFEQTIPAVTHPQEMNTVEITGPQGSTIKTIESQKEVFTCGTGGEFTKDVVIFTEIYENLGQLPDNPVVMKRWLEVTCVKDRTTLAVIGCFFDPDLTFVDPNFPTRAGEHAGSNPLFP